MTRLIAVASGKGGVGKTTSTVNIGAALAKFGRNVIVLDANLTTPNVGLHLGMHGPLTTLNDVIEGKATITDAIYLHHSGLRVIPAGISLRHLKSADPARLWDIMLDLFGSAEVVLLDTPAGLESGAKAVLDAAEEVLIITNPEVPAVTDALKTIRVAKHSGAQPIGVVINKVTNDHGEMSKEEVEAMLDLPVIAQIPFDKEITRSIKMKSPIVLRYPTSPAAKAYTKLSADLVGIEHEIKAEGWGAVHFLKKLFGVN
ncbi:MAG: cell division ATPase MinD [archaeon]